MSGSSNGEASGPTDTALPAGSAGSAASGAGRDPAPVRPADPAGDGPVVLPAPAVRRRGPGKKPIAVYHVTCDGKGQPKTSITFLSQTKEMREMVTQLGALRIPAPKSAVPAAEKRKRKEELDAKRKESAEDAKRKRAEAENASRGPQETEGVDEGGGGWHDLEPFRTPEEQASDLYLANLEDSDDAGESRP